MKSEKNILIAFILNLAFSVFEFIGGIFTNSVAIISDSIHDIGDAASIGISYLFGKEKQKATRQYSYIRLFALFGNRQYYHRLDFTYRLGFGYCKRRKPYFKPPRN